jgi:MFS family permease
VTESISYTFCAERDKQAAHGNLVSPGELSDVFTLQLACSPLASNDRHESQDALRLVGHFDRSSRTFPQYSHNRRDALWATFVAAALVGLGIGAEVDHIAFLTSRYFGLRSYGAIFGWIWAAFGPSGGFGAYLMGLGFDKTGSYVAPLSGFFCAAVGAILLILRLGPYRYRVSLPDTLEQRPRIPKSGSQSVPA